MTDYRNYSINLSYQLGFSPVLLRGKVPFQKGWLDLDRTTTFQSLLNHSSYNFGIITGRRSGVTVVDIDVQNGGLEYWSSLEQYFGLITTMIVDTGGGGHHYYFQYDPQIRNTNHAISGVGIDVRNDGGQVVFLSSIHPQTRHLYVLNPRSITAAGELVPIAPMPAWLKQLLPSC